MAHYKKKVEFFTIKWIDDDIELTYCVQMSGHQRPLNSAKRGVISLTEKSARKRRLFHGHFIVVCIDVKNINLHIKTLKTCFLHFYKNIKKTFIKNIKTTKKH